MTVPLSLSSVPAVLPYIQYVATGGQTVYPYPFPITQDVDLVVVINGVTQPTDSGYTLSGQGNSTGGNVTLNVGSTVNDIVTLFRNVTIQRLTQIGQNSGFSSAAFNAEFNNIYLILQQLQESITLSLQLPNTNSPAPTTGLTPASYANKYLSFDAFGNPTPAALTSSGSVTGAMVAQLLASVIASPPTADLVRSTAEITAGITPANYAYPPMHVFRYGADPLGIADSLAAFNNASLVANTGGGGKVIIPRGVYKVTGTVLFYTTPNLGQVIFEGAGKVSTTINYTGSASAFGVSAANTRIYDCGVRDMTITNSGGATGLVGLDLDSVSTSNVKHVTVSGFPTSIRQHSTVNGGSVYMRYYDVTAQMGTTPTAGFVVDTKGSNAAEFTACRYNGPNTTVGTAWQIVDSSGCCVAQCNIDQALVGYALTAPSGAGFCDGNIIHSNRNEGVGTVYNLGVNTRYTQIGASQYETITTLIVDSGTRNNILAAPNSSYEQYAAPGQATGNRRFTSTTDIGANPFFVVNDTATITAGSTVLQVETSSVNQTLLRGRTSGADKFTVNGAGDLGLHGNAPAAQVTGFGTPTGTGVINNFPGATATLAQCSQAIAQLITDLKATGRYGA